MRQDERVDMEAQAGACMPGHLGTKGVKRWAGRGSVVKVNGQTAINEFMAMHTPISAGGPRVGVWTPGRCGG